MAAGDVDRLSRRNRKRIEAAVERAEERTGLQFCVFLGTIDDEHPRMHAEALFVEAGLHERPAILVVVAPKQRRVEIVTSPHAQLRITDNDAHAAVATMTASFARGDLTNGVILGIEQLATIAGPGAEAAGSAAIPDVVDEGAR